jgi:DNA-directed RNA polymerase beta' subunit
MNSLVPRTLELPEKNVPHSFFSKKFIYGIDTRGSGGKVAGNQTSEKIRSFKKNLKNPLYTIPYFYPWPSELEWKSFMYYNSENLSLHDKPIAVYKNGPFQKFLGVTYSELVEEQYEKNNQLTETLTGASLIQKLLTELDSVEFQKMIKQHQILIPIVNRSIRKLSKNLSQTKSDFLKIQKLLQKRDHIIRRFKFLSKISWSGTRLHPSSGSFPSDETRNNPMGTKVPRVQQNTNPIGNSMILTILPVLPPDLRPILKLQNQIAASDLNRLYQRIIYRNERLKKFLKDPSTSQSFEMKYAQRLLQEAVDNLIENGKGSVKPETNARGQALKSLSEILKGKQGRFRQYLLGKRVDYSGRSVIVVGPSLKLSECGLPLRIAIELFLPFLIKKILHYKLAKTVIGAKNFIYNNNSFTWNLLNEIMKNHPILLNRAPTLHRLGIQAFLPKLIHGQAILLHPLVCPAFNADFDGDQMAVHVPITVEARAEAWSFLFSRNHLLSAATGEPIILPSQDMVLGCYYLTSENSNFKLSSTSWSIAGPQRAQQFTTSNSSIQKKSKSNQNFSETYSSNLTKLNKKRKTQPINQLRFHRKCFYNWDSVLNAYQKNQILLQSVIWVRWNGKTEFPNESFSPLEIRVNSFGHYEKIKSKLVLSLKPSVKKPYLNQLICNQYIRTTPGRVLINNVIQNCMRF